MPTFPSKTLTAAAALASVVALVGVTSAQAGVTSCAARGGKQEAGAVIGALVGGALGNSISGHNRTTGTVAGAAVGAAAGSAVGCEMQKEDPARYPQNARYEPATYMRDGYRLSSNIAPASYSRIGHGFVAVRSAELHAAPSGRSRTVGRVQAGERFYAMAHVNGTNWTLVGRGGVGVGYVRDANVRPEGARYAYGY